MKDITNIRVKHGRVPVVEFHVKEKREEENKDGKHARDFRIVKE